ncbi:MAG: hypothetical protein ACRCX2_10720 [Paraclostridium sp.]
MEKENLLTPLNVSLLLQSKSSVENKLICIEELAELQKEITKMERGKDSIADLVEEMADVYIVMAMLKDLYYINNDLLVDEINRKMKRNLDRVNK